MRLRTLFTAERFAMRHAVALLISMAGLMFALDANATPITYTLSTTASGQLGSQAFTDAQVTMTMYGDTAGAAYNYAGFDYNDAIGDVDLSIAGLAPTTFNSSMQVFYEIGGPPYYVGFQTDLGALVLTEYSDGLAGYDLVSGLGPLTGGTNQALGTAFETPTAAGDFFITSDPGVTTFTANIDSSVSPVPEPSALYLLATGALVLLGTSRRRLVAPR